MRAFVSQNLGAALIYLACIILLTSAFSSCVMPGDLRKIEAAQAEYRLDVNDTIGALRSESITPEQADARIESAHDVLVREIGSAVDAVEERTTAVASAAGKIPTDPVSLIAYLAGLAGAVGGASKLAERNVHRQRDTARKARGEPT